MEPLPGLNKKVLYLDQFAISEIFKTKTGKRSPNAHHAAFWTEANRLLERAILRQQVICPASNIHRDETIVYHDGDALGLAHEMLGGDTSFEDSTTIEHRQIYAYLDAYLKNQGAPQLQFDVDEILDGNRNAWLPDLHITVQTDWTAFAEDTRRARDKAASEFTPLYERWSRERPSFKEVLEKELAALAPGYLGAYVNAMSKAASAMQSGDVNEFMDGALSAGVRLIHEIKRVITKSGVAEPEALNETAKFFKWAELHTMPHHWISAHLFAAIADRLAKGQRRFPGRGMMNDIKAISIYGPYVDAMFIDNECAAFLEEKAVAKGVNLKARIFCLKRSAEFLDYLRQLGDRAPDDVVEAAKAIYGNA